MGAAWCHAGAQRGIEQGHSVMPCRSAACGRKEVKARGSASALRLRKGRGVWGARGVGLCKTQRGAVHGRNVGPRRGAAYSRAGV